MYRKYIKVWYISELGTKKTWQCGGTPTKWSERYLNLIIYLNLDPIQTLSEHNI